MKAEELEKILNELTTDKNGHIRGKGRVMDKIQSLHLTEIQSEYVEKAFAEFCIIEGYKAYPNGDYGVCDSEREFKTLEGLHKYWLKEVKNK